MPEQNTTTHTDLPAPIAPQQFDLPWVPSPGRYEGPGDGTHGRSNC